MRKPVRPSNVSQWSSRRKGQWKTRRRAKLKICPTCREVGGTKWARCAFCGEPTLTTLTLTPRLTVAEAVLAFAGWAVKQNGRKVL